MRIFKKQQKAFSLIEVISVLFILSIGLLGVLNLIIQNINSQYFSRQNIIAYQLAQEGVELIRQVRDTNWNSGANWNEHLSDGNYYMDYTNSYPIATGSTSEPLYLTTNNVYTHNAANNTLTKFNRLITISNVSDHEIRVTSTIDWVDGTKSRSYTLEALLYDWE